MPKCGLQIDKRKVKDHNTRDENNNMINEDHNTRDKNDGRGPQLTRSVLQHEGRKPSKRTTTLCMSEYHNMKDDFYSIRMTDEYYNTLDKDYNV